MGKALWRSSAEALMRSCCLFSRLNDRYTQLTVTAERAFLHAMEGGCQVPIAGFAKMDEDGVIELTGLVASPDGKPYTEKQ